MTLKKISFASKINHSLFTTWRKKKKNKRDSFFILSGSWQNYFPRSGLGLVKCYFLTAVESDTKFFFSPPPPTCTNHIFMWFFNATNSFLRKNSLENTLQFIHYFLKVNLLLLLVVVVLLWQQQQQQQQQKTPKWMNIFYFFVVVVVVFLLIMFASADVGRFVIIATTLQMGHKKGKML